MVLTASSLSYSRSLLYVFTILVVLTAPASAGEKKVPIHSNPSGATVAFQGNFKICKALTREGTDGVTPCAFSVEEGAFYAEPPPWEDSQLLQVPLKITVTKDGYLSEEIELTKGPNTWEADDAPGHIKRTYYYLIAKKFDIMLKPDPLAAEVKPDQLTTRPASDPLKNLTVKDAVYDCKRFYDQNDPERALQACNVAVILSGQNVDPNVYNYRCLANYQLRRYEPALDDCLTLARLRSSDVIWNNTGLIYQALGRNEEAVKSFSEALKANQNFAKAFRNRGISYERMNRVSEALGDYTSALKATPGDVDTLISRAHLYNRNRNCQAAESDANAAAASSAKRAEALIERGDARVCQESYDAAINDYTASLTASDAPAVLYIKRCGAYLAAKQSQKALNDCDEALKRNPEAPYALTQRAEVRLALRQYDIALADTQKALSRTPKDAWTLDIQGQANEGLGKLDAAITNFDEAVRSDPARAASYIHRARAHRLGGSLEAARRDLDAAKSLINEKAPASVQAELAAEVSAQAGSR